MKLIETKFKSKLTVDKKAYPYQSIENLHLKIQNLERTIESMNKVKKLKVTTLDAVYYINYNDIIYLKSNRNYTNIYLIDGKNILISKTLSFLVRKINDSTFLRTHSSYLINTNHLCQYIKSRDKVILINDIELPVSRSKKKTLINWLD